MKSACPAIRMSNLMLVGHRDESLKLAIQQQYRALAVRCPVSKPTGGKSESLSFPANSYINPYPSGTEND